MYLHKPHTESWGRGLAAIHDGRLRAELRTAAGHAAVVAALGALRGTPERSGGRHRSWGRRTADICDAGERPPRRRRAERGEQA
ncbi:hypothetical protein NDU88_008011 [Pleurodeles waltl]|uniref:Uncharacterized protein n=1 Tax=Pleurodeles waltl TaxID=8319 RepID=A0AAV7NUQ5_PLEWA|nr:hypothetical protein NDU88_008011 [Pleurodeles waltl]